MKKLVIILLIGCLMGCSKEDKFDVCSFEDSSTEQSSLGTRLVSIIYNPRYDGCHKEHFIYNSEGQIISTEQTPDRGMIYNVTYENNLVKEVIYSGNSINTHQDSFFYDSNGMLEFVYQFRNNVSNKLVLDKIMTYTYDSENKLSMVSHYSSSVDSLIGIERFYWEDNNIVKVEAYDDLDELLFESSYEYDDKINYRKGLPEHFTNPITWGENNVIFSMVKNPRDQSVNRLDVREFEYEYNLDNYPTFIDRPLAGEMKLFYE